MRYLSPLTGLFVAVLLISGVVSTKLVHIGPLVVDGGTLLFPLSYIFGDILTEVYGYKESRKVIRTGLLSMILMSVMIRIVGLMPASSDRTFQSDYTNILMLTPRIFFASAIAYCIGEFVNSYILAKLKVHTQGTRLRVRTILSTLIGQVFDTGLFVVIAFVGVVDRSTLRLIMISNYVLKVAIEIVFTPLTYQITTFLKKSEQIDVYDVQTNFNPFRF